jgi:predicted RNA binding protein with dsRBD fold (UPF0201 family)
MTAIEVSVRAEVYLTENREKVEAAVRNVLGDITLDLIDRGGGAALEGRYDDLESLRRLRDLLGRTRIRDAARTLFSRIAQEGVLSFGLNKQAAFAGHASFYRSGESALGPIQITIKGEIPEVIDYLCGSGQKPG